MTQRAAFLAYGALAYAIGIGTLLFTAGFLLDPSLVGMGDSGQPGPIGEALAVDLALLAAFAIQHSGMARPGFKRAWTRLIPEPIERATYVLLSSLTLIVVITCWQPLPGSLWNFDSGLGQAIGFGLFGLGIATLLYATMLIDHFTFFGLRQVMTRFMGRAPRDGDFVTPSLYRFVRHPIYLGWFVTLWATPNMSMGHLLFASLCSAYLAVAVHLEERDLLAAFGSRYAQYRATTPMFVPCGRRRVDGFADTPTA